MFYSTLKDRQSASILEPKGRAGRLPRPAAGGAGLLYPEATRSNSQCEILHSKMARAYPAQFAGQVTMCARCGRKGVALEVRRHFARDLAAFGRFVALFSKEKMP